MTTEMFEYPRVIQHKAVKRSGWRSGYQASLKSKTPFTNWRLLPTECEMCLEVYPTAEYQFFCPTCDFCRRCCGCRDKRKVSHPDTFGDRARTNLSEGDNPTPNLGEGASN